MQKMEKKEELEKLFTKLKEINESIEIARQKLSLFNSVASINKKIRSLISIYVKKGYLDRNQYNYLCSNVNTLNLLLQNKPELQTDLKTLVKNIEQMKIMQ